MKKAIITLICFFFVLALADGILQTSWAKGKIFATLQENLRKSGWNLEVEKINRAFPEIDLENATLSSPDFSLHFGSIQAEVSFTRLWKKEIVFTNLKADTVDWKVKKESLAENKIPPPPTSFRLTVRDLLLTNATVFDDFIANIQGYFSLKISKNKGLQIKARGTLDPEIENPYLKKHWAFQGRVQRQMDRTWLIQNAKVESDLTLVEGEGILTSQGKIKEGDLTISSGMSPLQGSLFAKILLKQTQDGLDIQTRYKIPFLKTESYTIENIQGEASSLYAGGKLEGTSNLEALFFDLPWKATIPFSWQKGSSLVFSDLKVESQVANVQGKLEISRQKEITAQTAFSINQLHTFFPSIYGEASGKAFWRDEDGKTILSFDTQGKSIYFDSLYAKEMLLYSDIENPLEEFKAEVVCDIKGGKWRELQVDEATIETTNDGENWPYSVSLFGKWGHRLDVNTNGFWRFKDDVFLLSLQNIDGSFFNHPLLLQEPVSFSLTPEKIVLNDFSLELAQAKIQGAFQKEDEKVTASLNISSLPIDFLSLNPLDIDAQGLFNLGLAIEGNKGNVKATFDDLEVQLLGEDFPRTAQGKIDGQFDRDSLHIKGDISTNNAPFLNLDLALPIQLEMWPLKSQAIYNKEIDGRLFFQGQIEDVLDFFNLQNHRLEGESRCDLTLTGSLERPICQGRCTLEQGYYQNYYTGTELKNIQATIDAKSDELVLSSFKATDAKETGSVTGSGKLELNLREKFPYDLEFLLLNVNLRTFDLVQTKGNGKIEIEGDFSKALARGNIEVLTSDIEIPSRLPNKVPEIEVTYKNAKAPPFAFELPEKNPYPLHLDLNVDAPSQIFISGRGLESEWKGNFYVKGAQTSIATKGQIELVKGKFVFSGRSFNLNDGSLVFSGVPGEAPVLNLSASVHVKDILITANLSGPLNNPQVTLQSSPPLPMGSIMSYLLFGEELAEINSFQALQLANSVASIMGGVPSIIEKTKKSLGVDRFEILSVPDASPEGGEKMAIQVGKYITEGVLVSYTQGAENSSGNIRIEVELRGNLSLVLESDQANEQKQGKFSFKWAHTY